MRKYPTLHAAIFNDSKTKEEVTPVQLLQVLKFAVNVSKLETQASKVESSSPRFLFRVHHVCLFVEAIFCIKNAIESQPSI